MLIVAALLLTFAGGLMLLGVLSNPRVGPEGPVGAHMVTAPLAIGQAVAVGIALGAGALADVGWLRTVVASALPGYVIAATVLPVTSLSPRTRLLSVVAAVVAIAGCVGVLLATHVPQLGVIGGSLVALVGLGGYVLVAVMLVAMAISNARAAAAAAEREDEWRKEQAAWQLGEWQKLPPDAGLWQLIQFAHAQDDAVRAQCRARIAAMPELDERMNELLRSGWAEHAISFVAHDYPRSRAMLAPALAEFLDKEFPSWESRLREATMPHTWSGNVSHLVAVMRATLADGGDLRAQAAQWAAMLGSIRGLAHFANDLAAAPASGPRA